MDKTDVLKNYLVDKGILSLTDSDDIIQDIENCRNVVNNYGGQSIEISRNYKIHIYSLTTMKQILTKLLPPSSNDFIVCNLFATWYDNGTWITGPIDIEASFQEEPSPPLITLKYHGTTFENEDTKFAGTIDATFSYHSPK